MNIPTAATGRRTIFTLDDTKRSPLLFLLGIQRTSIRKISHCRDPCQSWRAHFIGSAAALIGNFAIPGRNGSCKSCGWLGWSSCHGASRARGGPPTKVGRPVSARASDGYHSGRSGVRSLVSVPSVVRSGADMSRTASETSHYCHVHGRRVWSGRQCAVLHVVTTVSTDT